MASKGAAVAALPTGDPQPKFKSGSKSISGSKSKSSSKAKSEPKPSHDGSDGGEKKKPSSNPKPQRSDSRKPSSETPKFPSNPPAVSMAGDRSPDAGKAQRKRKAGDREPFSSPSKPSNDGSGAGAGSGKGRASDGKASYQEDCITILRAAIEFRKRTGFAPTQSQISQIYKSFEGSLHADMSEKQVWNRLRTLRANLKNAEANGHGADPVHKLSLELWCWNNYQNQEHKKEEKKEDTTVEGKEDDAEEDKKPKKAKKSDKEKEENEKRSLPLVRANGVGTVVEDHNHDEDMDEEEEEDEEAEDVSEEDEHEVKEEKPKVEEDKRVAKEQLPSVLQAYPYLARAVDKNWKKQGFPSVSLLDGLKVDPSKAKALDDKWKKYIDEEMKFQVESVKLDRDIIELMHQTHKKLK